MDARLLEVGLVKAKPSDNPYDDIYGTVRIPWYRKTKMVPVVFERDDEDEEPTDSQIDAFCQLMSRRESFFSELEERLFSNFNLAREESVLDEETTARFYPQLRSTGELETLVEPPSVLVSYYDGEGWSDYIGLLMGCSWEPEHGLGVKIVDGVVVEIGTQDIVL